MEEPRFVNMEETINIPYSQAPAICLQKLIAEGLRKHPNCNEFYDPEFRKLYAARLLRERGLL